MCGTASLRANQAPGECRRPHSPVHQSPARFIEEIWHTLPHAPPSKIPHLKPAHGDAGAHGHVHGHQSTGYHALLIFHTRCGLTAHGLLPARRDTFPLETTFASRPPPTVTCVGSPGAGLKA